MAKTNEIQLTEMKHRGITLTEKQEIAYRFLCSLPGSCGGTRVHFVWYPHGADWQTESTMDEFTEDADKVQVGDYLIQSWSGSHTSRDTYPVWERISSEKGFTEKTWKKIGDVKVDLDEKTVYLANG